MLLGFAEQRKWLVDRLDGWLVGWLIDSIYLYSSNTKTI